MLAARIEATNAINLVTSQTLNPTAVIDNNIATYTAAYGEPSPVPTPTPTPEPSPIPIPDPTPTPTPTPPEPVVKIIDYDPSNTILDLADYKGADAVVINNITGELKITGSSTVKFVTSFIISSDASAIKDNGVSTPIQTYLGDKGEEALIIGNENIELTADKSSWLTGVDIIVVNTTGRTTADTALLQALKDANKMIEFPELSTGQDTNIDISDYITANNTGANDFRLDTGLAFHDNSNLTAKIGKLTDEYLNLIFSNAKDKVMISDAKHADGSISEFASITAYGFDKDNDKFGISGADVETNKNQPVTAGNITSITIADGIITFETSSGTAPYLDHILSFLNTAEDDNNDLIVGANKVVLAKPEDRDGEYVLIYTGTSTDLTDDVVVRLIGATDLTKLEKADGDYFTIA